MAPMQSRKQGTKRKAKPTKAAHKAARKAIEAYHSSSDEDKEQSAFDDEDIMDTLDDVCLSDDMNEKSEDNKDDASSCKAEDSASADKYLPASLKGSSKLASTISKLLTSDTPVKSNDASSGTELRPILSKKRKIETDIDEEKLDAKARKVLSAERKAYNEKNRVIPDHTGIDYEKRLRKLATRGVVQLFNAIRAVQRSTEELEEDGVQKHSAEAPVLSKQTFIKTLKEENTRSATNASKPNGKKSAVDDNTGVAWIKSDFAMKAPKHWDQEEEEEEEMVL
ncbi:hypothetical protein BATDEDRAFT_35763 [Batrachochytrium dendrobatidis JAM81]|uniref:Rrp15p-domain-containing protein n=2 Tax=Batrachochytrium dendrobatidis TaxID=109871 RepID=F4P968_BATDJ|nr:uncharacterized protein BATDEDRAFT_35763 [Batrachochytrium dendrobatidis JAM81]EGF78289.1 hypothetical protein BATDEDRAFT_35763 [Batrachochytrium dendrobatidis JAM81]KAJ8331241.1 hypothetical protein O5D80_000798 [Batrachochytrium dendrobatidis]OAJ44364.1 hypothetical protein BDEG_27601 [Batrachochytrium dendrobatidis JEL423]|eukprot:XP_006681151.1 hypothetical protein BATDEDRAFT_35763 [Batrachochytrium dendrobatidis JAM81]